MNYINAMPTCINGKHLLHLRLVLSVYRYLFKNFIYRYAGLLRNCRQKIHLGHSAIVVVCHYLITNSLFAYSADRQCDAQTGLHVVYDFQYFSLNFHKLLGKLFHNKVIGKFSNFPNLFVKFSNKLTLINCRLDLGKKIKNKRKEDNLSAKDLAELLKVPMDRIYKWEKGARPSDPQDFILITKWLDGHLEGEPNKKIAIDYDKESMAKDLIQLKAIVKMLRSRHAKLEAKVLGRSLEEVLEELDNDTTINIKDLVGIK